MNVSIKIWLMKCLRNVNNVLNKMSRRIVYFRYILYIIYLNMTVRKAIVKLYINVIKHLV
jgi:hypothetical protein